MQVYLVCFDISDDDVRRRIGNFLLGYGERVQQSVFEVAVRDQRDLTALHEGLSRVAGPGDRHIRLYRLCGSCRKASQTIDGERIAEFPAVLLV